MKTTVYRSEFHDYFTKSDTYKNQFSYEAREILFDYFEELEFSIDDEIEFDLVAICCEYSESTLEEIIDYYGYMMPEGVIKDKQYIEEFLNYHSALCGSYEEGGETFFIYAQF